jgi:hypothetical protein
VATAVVAAVTVLGVLAGLTVWAVGVPGGRSRDGLVADGSAAPGSASNPGSRSGPASSGHAPAGPATAVPGARGLDAEASRSRDRAATGPADPAAGRTSGPSGGSSATPPGWSLVAAEDFTGPLSTGRWNVYDSKATNSVSTWSPSMVGTAAGRLVIQGTGSDPSGRGNVSGGLCWCGVGGNRTYGRWEVRAQFDRGTGFGPAVILWPASNQWPDDGEIDVVETPHGDRSLSYSTVHWGSAADHRTDNGTRRGDFSGWHTYAVDWLPGLIRITVDGAVVYDSTTGPNRPDVPSGPMHLALQQEPGPFGDSWVAAPNSSTPSTVSMRVDWVRIYRRS